MLCLPSIVSEEYQQGLAFYIQQKDVVDKEDCNLSFAFTFEEDDSKMFDASAEEFHLVLPRMSSTQFECSNAKTRSWKN